MRSSHTFFDDEPISLTVSANLPVVVRARRSCKYKVTHVWDVHSLTSTTSSTPRNSHLQYEAGLLQSGAGGALLGGPRMALPAALQDLQDVLQVCIWVSDNAAHHLLCGTRQSRTAGSPVMPAGNLRLPWGVICVAGPHPRLPMPPWRRTLRASLLTSTLNRAASVAGPFNRRYLYFASELGQLRLQSL